MGKVSRYLEVDLGKLAEDCKKYGTGDSTEDMRAILNMIARSGFRLSYSFGSLAAHVGVNPEEIAKILRVAKGR